MSVTHNGLDHWPRSQYRLPLFGGMHGFSKFHRFHFKRDSIAAFDGLFMGINCGVQNMMTYEQRINCPL